MTWRDKFEPRDKGSAQPETVVVSVADSDHAADAQSSDMENEGQGQHRDMHVTKAQSAVGVGIDAQQPDTMPRREDDVTTHAGSREFHDQPGSGNDIARRRRFFAPPQ